MSAFLLLTIAVRVCLACVCLGISALLVHRSVRGRNGARHYAASGAWTGLTLAMWYYILANIETWWWQSNLLQTFGLIVWIPALLAACGYLYVLWVNRDR